MSTVQWFDYDRVCRRPDEFLLRVKQYTCDQSIEALEPFFVTTTEDESIQAMPVFPVFASLPNIDLADTRFKSLKFYGQHPETEALIRLFEAAGVYEEFVSLIRSRIDFNAYLYNQSTSALSEMYDKDDDGVFPDIAICIAQDISETFSSQVHQFNALQAKAESLILQKQRRAQRKNKQIEQHLEDELYLWLIAQGVETLRQTSTSNRHRLDLWLPGVLMLELKASKVTGDDICQAIDYFSTYDRTILLVGTGLTNSASRGLEGFNRAIGSESLVFTTWGGVKPYLKSVLGLK